MGEMMRAKKFLRWTGLAVVVVAGLVSAVFFSACASVGGTAAGERLLRMQRSPQWQDGHFKNKLEANEPEFFPTLWQWMTGGSEHASPQQAPKVLKRQAEEFVEAPATGLRVTWFGHSTLMVEIEGYRVLIDPVWGDRASPFTWAGPERFHAPVIPLEALPELDAVLISHDHYDHLDLPTIERLRASDVPFVVPLGVGAHLEHWGIPVERIVELDWWEEHRIGALRLVATPSRHFSGRSLVMADRDHTLWSGWALIGSERRAYYSGDTAMFPEFEEIGERLGPFDVTMIESGAYNVLWADVHLGPEQAVQAHRMVRGDVMMPVHWGTFDLALHSWIEPAERVLAAAARVGVRVATPQIGQSFEPLGVFPTARWWPEVPFESVELAPVTSSRLSAELRARIAETMGTAGASAESPAKATPPGAN